MKFGPASPADALGGVTVHTLRQGSLVLKKGTTIGPAEVEALNKAGVKEVVVVRLEEGDVSEDAAAASIAQAVAGEGVNVERAFTGRANLFAAQAGVLVVDRAAVDRINGVDEAITFATLSAFKPVVEGEMIATVKLIPFGVEAKLRDAAVEVAGRDTLRIAPYVIKKVGVVSTLLPGLAPKVIDKTLRVTAERLAPAGASIIAERRVPHDEADLASSTPLMRSTAVRSTTSTPACAANRLARPVKARSTLTPSPATACAMLAAATSSETSPSSSRTTTISFTPALFSASTSAGPIVVPFLSTSDPCRNVCTVTPPIASAGLAGPNFMPPEPSQLLSAAAVRL